MSNQKDTISKLFKTKSSVIVLIICVVCLAAIGGYYLYKRTVSADVYGTIPSWTDDQTRIKLNSVWTTAQKQQFLGCAATGYTSKGTVTPDELSRLGAHSVAFEGTQGISAPISSTPKFDTKYRLIVTPLMFQTADGTTKAKFKFTLKNPTSVNMNLRKQHVRLSFWHVEKYDTYVDGSPHYFAADQIIYFNSGNEMVLAPNQEVTAESNILSMTNESYYTASLASESYYYSGNAIIWTGSGSASAINCVTNPISLITLKQIFATSPVPTVTTKTPVTVSPVIKISPSPTVTITTSPRPSPAASVSSVIIGGDVDTNIEIHRGWTAYGTTSIVDTTRFGTNDLKIFGFNGATNSWYSPPNTGSYSIPGFTKTELGRAYYILSSTAKTVPLPFRPLPVSSFTLTKGWNMLFNVGDKTLSNLMLTYNGVTSSAGQMIASNKLKPEIYIIENDQATASCNYFSILATAASPANCATGTKARVTSILSGKTFWVKVL